MDPLDQAQVDAEVARIARGFYASERWAAVGRAAGEAGRRAALALLRALYEDLGVAARHADGAQVEEALLRALPARLSGDKGAASEAVAEAVEALCRHILETEPTVHAYEVGEALSRLGRPLREALAAAAAARSGSGAPPPAGTGQTIVRGYSKLGRNDPCPCGSGLKYKKCCGKGG